MNISKALEQRLKPGDKKAVVKFLHRMDPDLAALVDRCARAIGVSRTKFINGTLAEVVDRIRDEKKRKA